MESDKVEQHALGARQGEPGGSIGRCCDDEADHGVRRALIPLLAVARRTGGEREPGRVQGLGRAPLRRVVSGGAEERRPFAVGAGRAVGGRASSDFGIRYAGVVEQALDRVVSYLVHAGDVTEQV